MVDRISTSRARGSSCNTCQACLGDNSAGILFLFMAISAFGSSSVFIDQYDRPDLVEILIHPVLMIRDRLLEGPDLAAHRLLSFRWAGGLGAAGSVFYHFNRREVNNARVNLRLCFLS